MRTPALLLSVLALALTLLVGTGSSAQATGAPAVPTTIVAHASASDQITVSWAAPPNTGNSSPVTYNVVTSPDNGSAKVPPPTTVSATSVVFSGLTAGTTYMFSVTASNQSGTSSWAYSNAVAASETPIPLTGTVSITGTPQFLQNLNAPPAGWSGNATYQFQWSVNGTPIPGATGVHFLVTDPTLVGRAVTASVVVSRPGFIDSPPQQVTSPIIAPAPMSGVAYYGGTPSAGHTWLAGTSGWPAYTTFRYQWTLDGAKTATTVAYPVAGNLIYNHKVGLSVTGSAPGYSDFTVTLPAAHVQPYNPLAGGLWPYDTTGGSWDHDLVHDYLSSTGTSRVLQGKIATRPRATWFGGWLSPQQAASMVSGYISTVQNGDPTALVQLTLHTIWTLPGAGGEDGRVHPLTPAQITTYKQWMKAVAAAIGTTRVAIIMEPDLALLPKSMSGEVNTADPMVRVKLVAWATKLLAANPNAAVYLDSGDSDWQHVSTMLPWLKLAGIQYARGFALGATHYSKATDDIAYGTAMVSALAKSGISPAHTHYVVDTADNGRGFTWGQWARVHGGASFNNASPCQSKSDPGPCASLGVAPTWQVIDTRLPLTAAQQYAAVRQLDGFLWFSRPWLPWQTYGYSATLGQKLAASSPYA